MSLEYGKKPSKAQEEHELRKNWLIQNTFFFLVEYTNQVTVMYKSLKSWYFASKKTDIAVIFLKVVLSNSTLSVFLWSLVTFALISSLLPDSNKNVFKTLETDL